MRIKMCIILALYKEIELLLIIIIISTVYQAEIYHVNPCEESYGRYNPKYL